MKRLIASAILAVIALWPLGAVHAKASEFEGAVIREICIVGATRTPEAHILGQLPYRVGDRWVDGFETLTLKRLQGMDLFDPQGLRVTLEPLDPEGVRVVVRVSDPHVLYNASVTAWALIWAGDPHIMRSPVRSPKTSSPAVMSLPWIFSVAI